MLPSDVAEILTFFAGHLDCAFEIPAKVLAPFWSPHPDARTEIQTFRIAAKERFGEHDEIGAAPGRIGS
jgi:hypothetical protein